MQDNLSQNGDVPMGDSGLDTVLNTIFHDNMDENDIQQSPLNTSLQPASIVYDPFSTSEPFAGLNFFVDPTGDEPMYNSPDGVCAQTPGYSNYNSAVQTPDQGTHITNLYDLPAQTPTSNPLGSPAPQLQPTFLDYPTPTSIPLAPTPEIQIPKTPISAGKKSRKARCGTRNKQKKEFTCHICGRISACASNLEEHLLTHTGVRDYSCTYINDKGETCNKRFARPWGLTRHCHDVHKVEVKVTKRRGVEYIGQSLGDGSPNNSKKNNNNKNTPVFDNPPTFTTATEGATPLVQYTPASNFDHIRILTSGPEGPCLCATCGWDFPNGNELMVHNHLAHDFLPSSYCTCEICVFTRETSFDDGSTFSNNHGSTDDNMEVEAFENDFKLDPMLRDLGFDNPGSDIGMTDACMFPNADTSITLINADDDTASLSSSPSSSIDEKSPIVTLPPANPYADERSAAWARIAENDVVTYDSEGFAWHSCPAVSPTTFYGLMGLDYNNMTDEQRRAYLGGA